MRRQPFDPARAVGAEPVESSLLPAAGPVHSGSDAGRKRFTNVAQAQYITVTQASELIKTTLEQRIPSPLRVIGEVSNLSCRNHWYFSLKDEASVLSCVAWATAARKFGFTPRDGDEVIATGHISHYGPQGRTQLYVSELVPVGAGALELRFRALCEQLRALGYFDESRKKPLPLLPRRVAVITSETGAAIHDVINTAAHRCKAVGLLFVDVRVQGEGAAEQIARAIRWVDRHHKQLGVDAVLVTRGGGSIEDLWAFNERVVADAVYKCSLPVVAAIGHESDTTIIELVADVRASTPTQAAMKLIPSAEELCRHVDHVVRRLGFLISRVIERQRQRLGELMRRDALRDPQRLLRPARERAIRASGDLGRIIHVRVVHERARLERLTAQLTKLQPREQLTQRRARLAVAADRMHRAIARRIDQRSRLESLQQSLHLRAARHVQQFRDRLTSLERHLAAVDPHQVLRRGYSITTRPNGSLIRSATELRLGDAITTRLADGSVDSIVSRPARGAPLQRNDGAGRISIPSRSMRKRKARQPEQADGPDLFSQ